MSLFLKHKFCKYLDEFYKRAEIITKDSKLYDKILSQLKSVLAGTYKKQQKIALNEAIDYLVESNKVKFGEADAEKINKILQKHLSTDLPGLVEQNMGELTSKALKLGLKDVGDSMRMKLSFDLVDKEAAEVLAKQNLFWVENFYGEQVKEKFNRTLKGYFEDGLTIEEAAAKLEVQFFDATDKGISYFEGLAEHTTSRVREIGKVNGYEKAGVEYLQVRAIIDDRTSEVCRRMNGTIIPVTAAMKQRDRLLGASSPEKVKTIAPWYDADALPDVADDVGIQYGKLPRGMQFPPYHWGGCRTITIAYFK